MPARSIMAGARNPCGQPQRAEQGRHAEPPGRVQQDRQRCRAPHRSSAAAIIASAGAASRSHRGGLASTGRGEKHQRGIKRQRVMRQLRRHSLKHCPAWQQPREQEERGAPPPCVPRQRTGRTARGRWPERQAVAAAADACPAARHGFPRRRPACGARSPPTASAKKGAMCGNADGREPGRHDQQQQRHAPARAQAGEPACLPRGDGGGHRGQAYDHRRDRSLDQDRRTQREPEQGAGGPAERHPHEGAGEHGHGDDRWCRAGPRPFWPNAPPLPAERRRRAVLRR